MVATRDEKAMSEMAEERAREEVHQEVANLPDHDRAWLAATFIRVEMSPDDFLEVRNDIFSHDGERGEVRLTDETCLDAGLFAEEVERLAEAEIGARHKRIEDVFGQPDFTTSGGRDWHVIRTPEQARMAGQAGETAVGIFWNHAQRVIREAGAEDSHVWAIMIDDYGRAGVSMAALKEGSASALGDMLADCHVTGYRNASVFRDFEEEIRAFCGAMDLVCTPNWMGQALPDQDAEETPAP